MVLSAIPAGRRALENFKEMILSVLKARRDFVLLSDQ